jgi:hypothetical protein
MTNDLTTKLREWLATEGYPLELTVGRSFQKAGWEIFHGQHYLDPESAKLREIDVHASSGPYVGAKKGMGMVSVHLLCECKVSQDKPWIVFTSYQGDDELRLIGRLTPGEAAANALTHAVLTNRDKFTTLVPGKRIGHGVARAFVQSRSADPTGPFAAVLGAMSATVALSNDHYQALLQGSGITRWLAIYLPLVVVQGQMFEFYLDESGNETLVECSRAHILAYLPGPYPDPLLVQLVTASALPQFALEAHTEARFAAQVILPETRRIWEDYWARTHAKDE